MTTDHKEYLMVKTVLLGIAGVISLFISTCAGADTVTAVTTKNWADLGNIIWALVFGVITILVFKYAASNKNQLEKAFEE